MDTPGKLGQFGPTQPPDALAPVDLQPLHRARYRNRAAADLGDGRFQYRAQRSVWIRELPACQHREDLVIINSN